jgi:hypothetical protein
MITKLENKYQFLCLLSYSGPKHKESWLFNLIGLEAIDTVLEFAQTLMFSISSRLLQFEFKMQKDLEEIRQNTALTGVGC